MSVWKKCLKAGAQPVQWMTAATESYFLNSKEERDEVSYKVPEAEVVQPSPAPRAFNQLPFSLYTLLKLCRESGGNGIEV